MLMPSISSRSVDHLGQGGAINACDCRDFATSWNIILALIVAHNSANRSGIVLEVIVPPTSATSGASKADLSQAVGAVCRILPAMHRHRSAPGFVSRNATATSIRRALLPEHS